MNQIFSALESGFTPDRILKYIKKIDPDLAIKVNTAMQGGHSIEQILSFISKNGSKISKAFVPSKQGNIYQEARKSVHPALKNAGAFAGTALAGSAGAYALTRSIPQAAQQLIPEVAEAAAGKTPIPPAPSIPQVAKSNLPSTPPQFAKQAGQELIESNRKAEIGRELIASRNVQPQPIQPQASQQPPSPSPIPQQTVAPLPHPLQKQVSAMLDAGNDVDSIAGALQSTQPRIVKEYEKATGQPIAEAVQNFASQNMPEKPQEKALPFSSPIMEEGLQAIEKTTTPIAEPTTIPIKKEKGSTVALPNGDIGEIVDIRQGIATVNANGKEFRRKVEELIEPPMEQKDLAELYKDLVSGIEEKTGEEVSRMVNWAGYDPKTNELAFVPHLGALYVYDNISPEDAAELTSILSTRKSTGENFIGAWKQGSKSPIGAAMYKLIQKLQKERGGKGSEYKGKYEKIYDAFELPKIEVKAKHAAENKAAKLIKEKIPESKVLQERFDKIAKKLTDLKDKPDAKNVRLQTERIKNLERLEKEYENAWKELREQLIHEKEMGEINEDIRKEKREAKKPRAS